MKIHIGSSNYYFTFREEQFPMTFNPISLLPLTERLHEVKTMASILFGARINRLDYMRRARVPGEVVSTTTAPGDGLATSDYLPFAPRTNAETSMVLWPYELNFRCFTPELAAVLEALEHEQ